VATKVAVAYAHDPADLVQIWLAVTERSEPSADEWKAALRDTVAGQPVVWARFEGRGGRRVNVWLRDRSGARFHSTTIA
jgi:hypothetical protein